VIAVSREPLRRSLRSLLGVILVALACTGALAAWAAGRLASRLTQPLSRIASTTRSVGAQNLGARIPVFSSDEELRHVTSVLNEMLARLDCAFQNQRRLVADASHELRTPLSNLRGTVEVALRRNRTDEEYRETLCVTLNEVDRLSRLVGDLLTLSRADAGGLLPGRGAIRLDVVAGEAVGACAERARTSSVAVRTVADGPVTVSGDKDQLRQVIDNLLDNALRHAPKGSSIEVRTTQCDGLATASVRDQGPGIPAAAQPHIFDRFYRADPARARRSGGTGLGLAIAQAIVTAHGGEITVSSQEGSGAQFIIRLPVASVAE
jgi:heavy metal sensor kinase